MGAALVEGFLLRALPPAEWLSSERPTLWQWTRRGHLPEGGELLHSSDASGGPFTRDPRLRRMGYGPALKHVPDPWQGRPWRPPCSRCARARPNVKPCQRARRLERAGPCCSSASSRWYRMIVNRSGRGRRDLEMSCSSSMLIMSQWAWVTTRRGATGPTLQGGAVSMTARGQAESWGFDVLPEWTRSHQDVKDWEDSATPARIGANALEMRLRDGPRSAWHSHMLLSAASSVAIARPRWSSSALSQWSSVSGRMPPSSPAMQLVTVRQQSFANGSAAIPQSGEERTCLRASMR